ncbi:putative porin, partial [Shewanella sp.]|uniref:putative porin n=1 Tax=Shewanella sp. TaxID=50422 RepID=UPI00258CC111
MKKSILSLAVLLGLVSTSANATDDIDSSSTFQHEANVTFNTNSDDLDDGLWSLDYRFYFSPVDTDNGPYALNGFLAQKSNIGAQYAQLSIFTDTVS